MYEISPGIFLAVQNLDIKALFKHSMKEIRPVLPCLVRMSLLSPLENTKPSIEFRKEILSLLIGIEVVNSIVSYLQVNYHELEIEMKKELQKRQKCSLERYPADFGLQTGIALGFERAEVTRKVQVVLSEIFNIQWQLADFKPEQKTLIHSEIFENSIYFEEVVDILCVALAELPTLLNILDLTDILLNVHNGIQIICILVANFPDSYKEVVKHILQNCGEDVSDDENKLTLLVALSDMNPSQALATRAICVELLKVPSFVMKLCLKCPGDMLPFLSGMLLGNDQIVRSWIAVFIRTSQKRRGDALTMLREELVGELKALVNTSMNSTTTDYTIKGAIMLRLYCSLRGIAGLKFNEEEIVSLSHLVLSRPRPTLSGLRFVSIALCSLIACPSLLSNTSLENKSIEWLEWLITEDAFFEKKSNITTSLDEMLLLIAIHFHNNQNAAIGDLVCSVLGMKVPIRPNGTMKIRQVFTQDIFSEQAVASHAVRVPVTPNLNANMSGYLPVHCIHQLLKSKVFLKHKVPIKKWIFKQICNSVRPLHPTVPALIELYINTFTATKPARKHTDDAPNWTFSKNQILHVFKSCDSAKLTNLEPRNTAEQCEETEIEVKCPITSQLLMVYYLAIYEDTCNMFAVSSSATEKKNHDYPDDFLARLPIKYLLRKAEEYQNHYVNLFQPLLRLIVSNFPQFSMVEDWLENPNALKLPQVSTVNNYDEKNAMSAILQVHDRPAKAIKLLKHILRLSCEELHRYTKVVLDSLPFIFAKEVPRLIQDLYKNVWMRLNSVLPISFWKMTINALNSSKNHMNAVTFFNDNLNDPLSVLRCFQTFLDSPYTLMIALRIIQGSLAASKAFMLKLQTKQICDKSGQLTYDAEREDLRTSLIASQDSATVHILIEVLAHLLKNAHVLDSNLVLREIQGIICSFIHQSFILEPSLAKLVHFQMYPRDVIPMIVAGVPSMHICIDFLHEFLSRPEVDKQIFTIDLASHLALKYSIPQSLGISKFCINTIATTLSHLSPDLKCTFLHECAPALIRFSKAFPILIDDCVHMLMIAGKSIYCQESVELTVFPNQMVKGSSWRNANQNISLIENVFLTLINELLSKLDLY